jgi:hypothetical protein
MGQKSHNGAAVRFLAELAHRTGHIFVKLRRADGDRSARWGCGPWFCIGRDNANHRPGFQVREAVGLGCIVGAEIYGESPRVTMPNPFNGLGAFLVGVSETPAAYIGPDHLAQRDRVHLFTLAPQVPGYSMAPQLAELHFLNK